MYCRYIQRLWTEWEYRWGTYPGIMKPFSMRRPIHLGSGLHSLSPTHWLWSCYCLTSPLISSAQFFFSAEWVLWIKPLNNFLFFVLMSLQLKPTTVQPLKENFLEGLSSAAFVFCTFHSSFHGSNLEVRVLSQTHLNVKLQ